MSAAQSAGGNRVRLSARRATLLVACGAAVGGSLRYALSDVWLASHLGLPWPLLLINCLGALLIGGWAATPPTWHRQHLALTVLIGPGFCGGLTTFSLFSLEWWQLWQQQGLMLATAWLTLTILCWLAAVSAGFFLLQALTQVNNSHR